MNVSAEQTLYFYKENCVLLQAVDITFEGAVNGIPVKINLKYRDKIRSAGFIAVEGKNFFRMLMPSEISKRENTAGIELTANGETVCLEVPVGGHKPWTIYVAQDKHLDYGWKHPVEEVMTRINRLTDYYMDINDEREMHFNFDCTLWFDEYRRARPAEKVDKLAGIIRSGSFQMGALTSVMFNGILTEEELIASLMSARRLEREFGIHFNAIMPNEAPGMNWGMAAVLAGAGIKYIVRGAYDLNNKNIRNREPYPLFWWEGPDGARVLTKFDLYEDTWTFGGYAEARSLRLGSYEDRKSFVERAALRYEAYDSYPFDAILLAGTGWDEYPFTAEFADFIEWFNSQGWEYPKLIDATWDDYFKHIEGDAGALALLPVLKGDFGTAWEEWLAQLAYINTLYRKARRFVLAGQTASAMAALLTGHADARREAAIYDSFMALCKFADHNIGGISPYEAYDTRDRKIAWVYAAMKQGFEALESSVSEIAGNIACEPGSHIVLNTLSWERDGVMEIMLMEELGQPGRYRVTDCETGDEVPFQIRTTGKQPEHYLSLLARNVPSFGCKLFKVEKMDETGETEEIKQDPEIAGTGKIELSGNGTVPEYREEAYTGVLENKRFRIEVDPVKGGIISLYDKTINKELADGTSPYGLNEYLYTSEGQPYSNESVKISMGQSGPVLKTLIVEGSTLRSTLKTTYTLYEELDCIDIENILFKEPSKELQTCHFIFPFDIPGREYHYDGTAAILKPGLVRDGGSQLPGAAMGTYCGLHFADASNSSYGVTLCSPDTHLYHFGSNTMGLTEGYIDPSNSTIYSVALENYNRNDNCPAQGNQDAFIFRYRIVPHAGGFDASGALKAGIDASRPLVTFPVGKPGKVAAKTPSISLITVKGEGIVTSGVKNADEMNGLVVRLRNCSGQAVEAEVMINACEIGEAYRTDLVERDIEPLPVVKNSVKVTVPALGLVSVRFVLKKAL